jgi:hypothetical protein
MIHHQSKNVAQLFRNKKQMIVLAILAFPNKYGRLQQFIRICFRMMPIIYYNITVCKLTIGMIEIKLFSEFDDASNFHQDLDKKNYKEPFGPISHNPEYVNIVSYMRKLLETKIQEVK